MGSPGTLHQRGGIASRGAFWSHWSYACQPAPVPVILARHLQLTPLKGAMQGRCSQGTATAAGGCNLQAGKSMRAWRPIAMLPTMPLAKAIGTTRIHQVAGLTGACEEGRHARVTAWRLDANGSRTASQTHHRPGVMEPVALAAVAVRIPMPRGTRREPGDRDIRNAIQRRKSGEAVDSQNDHARTISSHAFLTLIQCEATWSVSHYPAPRLLASQARAQQSMA
jgi:hypothetical protein